HAEHRHRPQPAIELVALERLHARAYRLRGGAEAGPSDLDFECRAARRVELAPRGMTLRSGQLEHPGIGARVREQGLPAGVAYGCLDNDGVAQQRGADAAYRREVVRA